MTIVALLLFVFAIGGWMSPWLLLALMRYRRGCVRNAVVARHTAGAGAEGGPCTGIRTERNRVQSGAGYWTCACGCGDCGCRGCRGVCGELCLVFWSHSGGGEVEEADYKRTAPPESFAGATVAAIRYVRYSPTILTVVVRTGAVMFFSSALFALLPTVARSVNESALGYGLLLGTFGVGAILGALITQPARARWSTEQVVSAGVVILGLVMVAMSGLHRLSTLAPVMLIGGAAWVLFISLISALIQNLAPDWVRARVLAVFILVYQGTFALGSAAWGVVAQRAGVGFALVVAGIGTISTLMIALFAKLPDSTADLSPWNHWRMPSCQEE